VKTLVMAVLLTLATVAIVLAVVVMFVRAFVTIEKKGQQ
jgi:hypothetical protein